MKLSLLKSMICNRLDAGDPPSVRQDDELGALVRSLEAVDDHLRAGCLPTPEPPAGLHAAIMRRVHREAGAAGRAKAWWAFEPGWTWTAAGAAAGVALAALITIAELGRGGRDASSYSGADASTLPVVAGEHAAALLGPLQAELENVTADLDRTAGLLLASLP